MQKEIHVFGTGGLGNCLFQICTAIYYAETYGYNIIFDDNSKLLKLGSSSEYFYYRDKTKRIEGNKVGYDKTILNKFTFRNLQQSFNYTEVTHFYENNKIVPKSDDIYLKINGWCQNYKLFYDVFDKIFKYFNFQDNHIKQYIKTKYNINETKKNIMIGLRIDQDFIHMTKITEKSYEAALNTFVEPDETDYNLIVISDKIEGREQKLNFPIKGNIIYVDESDIDQIYAGLMCSNFILSESTFHYWIALFKQMTDPNINVICFNDTDITIRELALPTWISIDY